MPCCKARTQESRQGGLSRTACPKVAESFTFPGHGRPHLLTPDFQYRRQKRIVESFGLPGIAKLYDRLSVAQNLPPFYALVAPGTQLATSPQEGSTALLVGSGIP